MWAPQHEPVPPDGAGGDAGVWHCYRHPGRESGVRCRRCEQPICPDCMISAPVGFQCPRCVAQAPPVRTMSSLATRPRITVALIAVSVALFVPSLAAGGGFDSAGPDLVGRLALHGPDVADGEWWRLVTSGFLHFGLIHLGFNMVLLYQLGSMLEPALGPVRFAALYATALLTGSFGALLLQPGARTAGASGAVFGLMAAAFLGMRRRGIDPMQSGIGGLLGINLLLTFVIPGISIGGHLGGLAGGAAAAAVLFATEEADHRGRAAGVAGAAALAAAAVIGSVVTATTPLWPF